MKLLLPAAWVIVLAGLGAATISVRALHQQGHTPGLLPILMVVVPYLAGGMLLHITGKARVVIYALLLPALFDIGAAFTYGMDADPAWDVELKWRIFRVGVLAVLAVPLGLGLGVWLDRHYAKSPE